MIRSLKSLGCVGMDLVPICYLACGEVGRIEQLVGDSEDIRRLEELGLRCGESIEMLQPGSPCIVRLGGSRLCFRESDTLGVMVQTVAAG